MMTAEELAQFEVMRLGGEVEIQARYRGDFDAARQHMRNTIAGKQSKAAFERASRSRAAELRAKAEARGLLKDQPARAKEQLAAGKQLLSDAAHGKTTIRMEVGGVDVTDQFDLTSVDSSTGATRGTAGKAGFDQSFGVTAEDLKAMIEALIEEQLTLRAGGSHG